MASERGGGRHGRFRRSPLGALRDAASNSAHGVGRNRELRQTAHVAGRVASGAIRSRLRPCGRAAPRPEMAHVLGGSRRRWNHGAQRGRGVRGGADVIGASACSSLNAWSEAGSPSTKHGWRGGVQRERQADSGGRRPVEASMLARRTVTIDGPGIVDAPKLRAALRALRREPR